MPEDYLTRDSYPFELRPIDLTRAALLYRELLIDRCGLVGDMSKPFAIRLFERSLKQVMACEFKANYAEYTTDRLFEIEGVPYIAAQDYYGNGYCLSNPFDFAYAVNDELNPGQPFPPFTAPIVFKRDCPPTFREFLKTGVQNNFRPHFLGTKAERIQWRMITDLQEAERLMVDTANYGVTHCASSLQKFGKRYPEQTYTDLLISWVYSDIESHAAFIGAWDVQRSKYVCAMSFNRFRKGWNTVSIAPSHEEEYKPYSLVVAAHIAFLKFAFYDESEVEFVDLGHNFESFSYKDVIKNTYISMKSLPTLKSLA